MPRLDPPPRFDHVYRDVMKRMDREERSTFMPLVSVHSDRTLLHIDEEEIDHQMGLMDASPLPPAKTYEDLTAEQKADFRSLMRSRLEDWMIQFDWFYAIGETLREIDV